MDKNDPRALVHRHNSFSGQVIWSRNALVKFLDAPTTTDESREITRRILQDLNLLATSLKTRRQS